MATYSRLADLPLVIEDYTLERLERVASPEFTRATTTVHLRGGGHEGLGEDVGYDPADHARAQEAGPVLPLAGEWTFDSFSRHLDSLDLFPGGAPAFPAYQEYRRWAYESAALDLALRQAGTTLHETLGREARPLTFGVSLRLGVPPSWAPLERRPQSRFKLDYDPSWDAEFVGRLAQDGRTDVVDFKGAYKGTPVDVDTDPALYALIAEQLPGAWLEDPDLTDADARAALEPYRDRVTWDAPIHSVEDVEGLDWTPKCLNCKPSRFGPVSELLRFYDYCAEQGIELYGGGQSELGVGRGQIQLLAAIFHPDGPNDVAPKGWDWEDPPADLPASPLDPAPDATGFRRRA